MPYKIWSLVRWNPSHSLGIASLLHNHQSTDSGIPNREKTVLAIGGDPTTILLTPQSIHAALGAISFGWFISTCVYVPLTTILFPAHNFHPSEQKLSSFPLDNFSIPPPPGDPSSTSTVPAQYANQPPALRSVRVDKMLVLGRVSPTLLSGSVLSSISLSAYYW